MSHNPEAIIIGAGPAGSLCAFLLANAGMRTRLVDRAAFPRPKLCGGCLASPGYEALRTAGLGRIGTLANAPEIDRLDLRAVGRSKRLVMRVPRYRVLDRAAFDRQLAEAAVDAGAVFTDRTRALVQPDRTVRLERDGAEEIVRPKVVIVADGLKGGSLRGMPGFEWITRPANRVGLGVLTRRLPEGCDPDAITMHAAPHGYLGVAPLAGGSADLAAAVDPRWIAEGDGPALPRLLDSFGIDPECVEYASPPLGAPRLTRRRERVEQGGWLFLCGDATGYLEPFTGEGMTWAVTAAGSLAPLLTRAIKGTYAPGEWEACVRREQARNRLLCRATSELLRRPAITRGIICTASALPPLRTAISGAVGLFQAGRAPLHTIGAAS